MNTVCMWLEQNQIREWALQYKNEMKSKSKSWNETTTIIQKLNSNNRSNELWESNETLDTIRTV